MDSARRGQEGLALVTVLALLALLSALLLGYFTLTSIEQTTARASMNSRAGFYAAEGGLNLRADVVRAIFQANNTPVGTSPTTATPPCTGTNLGTGDFACTEYWLRGRRVVTYLEQPPNPSSAAMIARGEAFQNLHTEENRYIVHSRAINSDDFTEAALTLHFKSRSVPMFQFPAFYGKDLEVLPEADLLLAGPVHTNGDLYVGTSASLDIEGQVTVAGDLYRGRKDANVCPSGPVRVNDPDDLMDLPPCTIGRRQIAQADVAAWGAMIHTELDPVSVPGPDMLDPVAGRPYWSGAHLRVVLDLDSLPLIQVRNADQSVDLTKTALLQGCGAVSSVLTFFDNREGTLLQMLDLNLDILLTCSDLAAILGVDLASGGPLGLVIHLTVEGPVSTAVNNYGVRVSNASELASILPGGRSLRALTLASDQPVYVRGNFNTVNRKPAAILGDTINVLSGAWLDASSLLPLSLRTPTPTTIQAALLGGTDSTGGLEGAGGQDAGSYNGGFHGFLRLHENWDGVVDLNYRGSFVSLGPPRHVDGPWAHGAPVYTAPDGSWTFETDFRDPTLLPPLPPKFVYLRQEETAYPLEP